jgi:DmsE family decaheme c-type cytochrome
MVWLVAFASARASAPVARDFAAPAKNAAQAQKPAQPAPAAPATKVQQTAPPGAAAAVASGDRYIGEAACVDCHDKQKQGYFDSKHHRPSDVRAPAAKDSCETCHGPGGKHSDDPVLNPFKPIDKMKAAEVTAICSQCHNRGEHALWDGSQHESRGVTCTTCHSVHAYKSEQAQLKKETQMQVCATCHRDKVAKLQRSAHMPVREGKMECTTCHNTHGSTNTKMLRTGDSVAEACTSCHAEKRGPYLWEHAPGRDGCVTCHDPHGSANDRMLVTRTPMLCQRCHIGTRHPATMYDGLTVGPVANPSIRVAGRSCVTCHAAIHGSNHPSGQRFTR